MRKPGAFSPSWLRNERENASGKSNRNLWPLDQGSPDEAEKRPQRGWAVPHQWTSQLNAVITSEKAIVDKDNAFAAKQLAALFFDAHDDSLGRLHSDPVCLFEGFVEPSDVAFDFLLVELDDQPARKLIKIILDSMLLKLANFDIEFHGFFLQRTQA